MVQSLARALLRYELAIETDHAPKDLVEADRHVSEAEDRIARHTEHHNEAETDDGLLWMMEQSLLEKRKHRREILRSLDKLKSRS
jgi:hypothetical protein